MTRAHLFWRLEGKLAVPCADMFEAATAFEKTYATSRVAETQIGPVRISTIFLPINHRFGDGAPLLFETMIFRGGGASEQFRCSSWQEAEAQHAEAVAMIRAEIKEKVNL